MVLVDHGREGLQMSDQITNLVEKINNNVLSSVSSRMNSEDIDRVLLGIFQEDHSIFKAVLGGAEKSRLGFYCLKYREFFLSSEFLDRFATATEQGLFQDIVGQV